MLRSAGFAPATIESDASWNARGCSSRRPPGKSATVSEMLIIAGSITTEDGHRDAFLTAVKPMVAATHTEPGCREYVFSPDPDDDNRLLVFEMWDDQDAL